MKLVRLKEWRERRAMSQEDLAERSGVGRAAISKYENGRREAHPATARRIADALEVEPQDLLFSADMQRPAWGKSTGQALDAAREEGHEIEMLQRYAEEVEAGTPSRSMYETYQKEAEFMQALKKLDVSKLPARSGALLLAYMELVGSFVGAGVKIPAGLARSVAEVLRREESREGKEEHRGE